MPDLDWAALGLGLPAGCSQSGREPGRAGELPVRGRGSPHSTVPRTHEEAPDLVGPPLDAQHQHAGDGQAEEGAPVLQALPGPA